MNNTLPTFSSITPSSLHYSIPSVFLFLLHCLNIPQTIWSILIFFFGEKKVFESKYEKNMKIGRLLVASPNKLLYNQLIKFVLPLQKTATICFCPASPLLSLANSFIQTLLIAHSSSWPFTYPVHSFILLTFNFTVLFLWSSEKRFFLYFELIKAHRKHRKLTKCSKKKKTKQFFSYSWHQNNTTASLGELQQQQRQQQQSEWRPLNRPSSAFNIVYEERSLTATKFSRLISVLFLIISATLPIKLKIRD